MDTQIIADHAAKSTYTDVATWLHSIADCINLASEDAPELTGDPPYVILSILPRASAEEASRIATVDALAQAILGHPGELEPNAGRDTGWGHIGRGEIGCVRVTIHTGVAGPPRDEVQAELIALRAENELLRAELDAEREPEGASR